MAVNSTAERRAFWQLQFCVFLWGFTAILGKLISLAATPLVVWRMGLATAMLALLPGAWRGVRGMSRAEWARQTLAGCVIALHWVTFYASIKLANASVAVACLALGAVFAAIIEPAVTGRPYERSELLLGVAAIPGVLLLIGGVPEVMLPGVAFGTLSAALTALYSSLNKRFVGGTEPSTASLLQIGIGTVFLAAVGAIVSGPNEIFALPDTANLGWLLVLAGACTVLPMLIWMHALHHVSAFTTQLALNLEPVYAIALAALLFHEHEELSPGFYLGALIVLLVVFLPAALKRKR